MTELASYIWGDYNTDRIPSSGLKEPKKRLIREWGTWVEGGLNGAGVVGRAIHATRASLYADLAHAANTMAWVWNDPTVAYNGIYQKVGASGSGSWTRLTDLPYSFLAAQNDGDGTANAIEATTAAPVPVASGRTLIMLPIFATNTDTPVTVEFNEDGSPLTIKTSAGNDPVPGGLVAGMIVAGWKDGSTFRMLSDQTSAAIQAAAEDAADRAEAAAAGIAITTCATRTELKALDPSLRKLAVLREAGREGSWAWRTGDYAAQIAADTAEGIYLKANAVAASAGAWVRQYDGPVLAKWFGVLPGIGDVRAANDVAIATAALQANKVLAYAPGTYALSGAADFSALDAIEIPVDVIFDFTSATVAANFPGFAHVIVSGAALSALPDLVGDVARGATVLEFQSPPGLQDGEWFCIYNPTNGSFHGSRPSYRAGEWCQVASVSGNFVRLYGSADEAYLAASIDLYKHPSKRFEILGAGRLVIAESAHANLAGCAGFRANNIVDADFSKVRPTNSGYAGIVLDQCIRIGGTGYQVNQRRFTGNGTQYGVVIANSQHINIQGDFCGGRHAVTTGGFDKIGCVPCRHIRIVGSFRNSHDAPAGTGAANTHGNSKYIHYEGLFDGGFSGGGDYVTVRGKLISKQSQGGVCILLSELVGFNFDFQNCHIYAAEDPFLIGRGVIDCGGNALALDAYTTRGGCLRLDGVTVDAPIARRAVVLRNRGYVGNEKLRVSMQDFAFLATVGAAPLICVIDSVSGNVWDELVVSDELNVSNAGWSVSGGTRVRGWRDGGSKSIVPSTAASVATADIVFSRPAPRAPKLQLTLVESRCGGSAATAYGPTAVSATGATIGVRTDDEAVFASTVAGTVAWLAHLE